MHPLENIGKCYPVAAWYEYWLFSLESITQKTQNICIEFVQRRPNVFDVGPTLYKCYTNVW